MPLAEEQRGSLCCTEGADRSWWRSVVVRGAAEEKEDRARITLKSHVSRKWSIEKIILSKFSNNGKSDAVQLKVIQLAQSQLELSAFLKLRQKLPLFNCFFCVTNTWRASCTGLARFSEKMSRTFFKTSTSYRFSMWCCEVIRFNKLPWVFERSLKTLFLNSNVGQLVNVVSNVDVLWSSSSSLNRSMQIAWGVLVFGCIGKAIL